MAASVEAWVIRGRAAQRPGARDRAPRRMARSQASVVRPRARTRDASARRLRDMNILCDIPLYVTSALEYAVAR